MRLLAHHDAPTLKRMAADELIDDDRLKEIAETVIGNWSDYLERGVTAEWDKIVSVASIYGIAMHNTNLLGLVSKLYADGTNPLLLVPQVRLVYESGITAQWIAQVGDAANAWISESRRQSKNLVEGLESSQHEHLRSVAEGIRRARVDYQDPPSASKGVARRFDAICDDVGVGKDGSYQYYKLMCTYSHPSLDLSETYLETDSGPAGFRTRTEPDFGGGWIAYIAIIGTVWAQMAFQYHAKDRVFRNSLREIARELGVLVDLKPTGEAWKRLNVKP